MSAAPLTAAHLRGWQLRSEIDRESEHVCSNLWENKYWSCC